MNKSLLLLAALFLTACAPGSEADSDAADRAAIIDLQHRYVLAMDYFDADGYAAVFTEDGVLDWARGEVKGRAAIREFMASGTYDLRKMNFAPATTPDGKEWPSTVRHLITNQVIEIDGDNARAVSYWMNYGNNADRRKIEWLSFGSWDDRFVKIDGKWFFERHTIYNEGNPNRFTAGQENPLNRLTFAARGRRLVARSRSPATCSRAPRPLLTLRAPARMPNIPRLPSWHAYSISGSLICFIGMRTVQGCVHVEGSDIVTSYCNTSGAMRVKRSTRCRPVDDPIMSLFEEKPIVSTTSVSPSQCPRELPSHCGMPDDRCGRPSSGITRAL